MTVSRAAGCGSADCRVPRRVPVTGGLALAGAIVAAVFMRREPKTGPAASTPLAAGP